MMHENWEVVKEIVASALERGVSERHEYIRQACGEDEKLREEVESLVGNYEEADSLLEHSPALGFLAFSTSEMIGRRVGPYRILSEAGHGGMAIVYLAERADQEYQKCVAIKMIKPGVHSDEIIRRFRRERQTLAALDHPHIIRLLDGGTTKEGWPYLVMEFVDGIPIDQYCDVEQLSIRDRLKLFRSVCSAVHYAHQHKIIHRDLKPRNILITKDGEPRLLDFGISKLFSQDNATATVTTVAHWRPMTPEYASPEQIRGKPVTSATDVYSLGVLLYELLSGHRPYRSELSSWEDIERNVCKEEPTKPSTVVSETGEQVRLEGRDRSGDTVHEIFRVRKTNLEGLRRSLQGDLDNIVLMALRKDALERYASVDELSKDIERHLSGRPVTARRPTIIYRGQKFVRRHHEALVAASAAVVLAASAAFWLGHGALRHNGPAKPPVPTFVRPRPSVAILGFKNLIGRHDKAWLSTAFSEMLGTDLAAGESLRIIPAETVARTEMDLGLSDPVAPAPDTLQHFRKNLGSDFVLSGAYFDAGKITHGGVRLDLRLQDSLTGETVAAISETGTEEDLLQIVSRSGNDLRTTLGLGRISDAETASFEAAVPKNAEAMRWYSLGLQKLRQFDALGARDSLTRAVAAEPSFALAHSALSRAWTVLGYDARAREEAEKALHNADRLSPENHLFIEGGYYVATKNWPKAKETYQTLHRFFPDEIGYSLHLADVQRMEGNAKEALATLNTLAGSSLGATEDPRIDLARAEAAASLSDNQLRRDAAERAANLAQQEGARLLVARARATECRALANLGHNGAAISACDEAKKIFLEVGDRDGVGRTLHAMAEVPLNQGDFSTARKLYEEELSIFRETGDQGSTAVALGNLALVLAHQGDILSARKMYDESFLAAQEAGDKNMMTVDAGNLGNLLLRMGQLKESLQKYEEVLKIANEIGDKSSAAIALDRIGEVLVEQGKLVEAIGTYQQALTTQRQIGQRHYYSEFLFSLGKALQLKGDLVSASKDFHEALAIHQELKEAGDAAAARLAIAELDCDLGKPADAEPLVREALQTFVAEKETGGEVSAQGLLAKALFEQGKIKDAAQTISDAISLSEASRDERRRLGLDVIQAKVLAAGNHRLEAMATARAALSDAKRRGFVLKSLEASLVLGEIQLKNGYNAAGRARLMTVEREARQMGIALVARKAAAARSRATAGFS
ncbi:MAG TPA: tetratricopeptide repeat protein [Candidatus Acidoferrales bacterium]|nr:tetratricopeptide repeat protein [Candidatus Acidoferrales bacterium]